MIERWKDTAFGTDFGGDFMNFLEEISTNTLTMADVFKNCDLEKYFSKPELLNERTDNNVELYNQDFEMYVHYEDAVIALSAIVIECVVNGKADLRKAYGSKTLSFTISNPELVTLRNALVEIHDKPEKYILFEMCLDDEREETLTHMNEIIAELNKHIN